MSIQTRTAQNVITKEIVDDRVVGSTTPYACSGEVDHFQHCVLCCCSGLLWIPFWVVACIVPGFCPTPCGDNCSCEAKRFIDPIKRLMWRLGKVNQVFTVEISPRPQLVAGLVDPSPEILRAPVSGAPCVMYVPLSPSCSLVTINHLFVFFQPFSFDTFHSYDTIFIV